MVEKSPTSHGVVTDEYSGGRLRSEAIFESGLAAVSTAIRDGVLEQSGPGSGRKIGLDYTAIAKTALKALRGSRTVATASEIPIGAVAYNHADGSIVARHDEEHGVVFGVERAFPWKAKYLRGPLTILWHPDDGPTAGRQSS